MVQDPRDERFVEEAVACGALDQDKAARLLDVRRKAKAEEPIEDFAIRTGFLRPEAVERVYSFARGHASPDPAPSLALSPDPASGSPSDAGLRPASTDLLIDSAPPLDEAIARAAAASMRSPGARPGARARDLPERFGPFDILNEIARGGMGVVYRARRTGTTTELALKVLIEGKDATEDQVRRFEREITAGLRLDHEGIVKVLDGGMSEGRLYFTMELIEGTSLDKVVASLSLRARIEVLEKVARAVHHAHEKGYIHRDLKPQNILLTTKGEPKVADFGLARSIDRSSRLTKTGTLVGTPFYMSPEQARGAHDAIDRRSDVYALGAVLYQLLTGKLPFEADTALGLIGKIMNEEAIDPCVVTPGCPLELGAIAEKCLEKDPEERFQSALDLARELACWLAGQRVSTVRSGAVSRLLKLARRRKRSLALLAAAAIVVAIPSALFIARVASYRRQAREVARHAEAVSRRGEIEAAVKTADAILASYLRLGAAATDRVALKDALAELDRVARETNYPENSSILATTLVETGAVEHWRLAEAALLVIDAATARDAELPGLRTRLEAALAASPGRDDVRLALASVEERAGSPEDAAALLEAATRRPAPAPEIFERLAELRLTLRDPRAAATSAQGALHQEPQRRSARLLLARALGAADDPSGEAIAHALEKERPRDTETRAVLAEATFPRDRALAIDALRVLEGEVMNDASVALRMAELLLRAERPEEAILAFKRASDLAPRDPRPFLGRAEARLLDADTAGAIVDLGTAASLSPPGGFQRARARSREAWLRGLLQGPGADAALALAREALAERPKDPELARLVFALSPGSPEDSVANAAASLGHAPGAALAFAALARARLERGQVPQALVAARQGVAIARVSEALFALVAAVSSSAEAGEPVDALRREAHATFRGEACDGARLLRAAITRERLATRFGRTEDKAASALLLTLAGRAAPWAADPLLEQGRRAASGRVADDPLPLLERGLALAGEDDEGAVALALVLLERDEHGNAGRAEALAGRVLSPSAAGPARTLPDATRAQALTARGRARLALGHPGEAFADLDAATKLDRHFVPAWAWKARALDTLGLPEPAALARKEADERGPARTALSRAAENEGNRLTFNGDPDIRGGILAYRRSCDLDPERAGPAYKLAMNLVAGTDMDPEEPIYYFARAAYLSPDEAEPEGDTIQLFRQGTDLDKNAGAAEERYAKDGRPDDLWTGAFMREIAVETGDESHAAIRLARLDMERALCADPANVSALLYRGFQRALERRSELAGQDLERFLRYIPKAAFAHFAWALALARDGHPREARTHLARALELNGTEKEKLKRYPELIALQGPR